ncbi:hypothetical protein EXIGLDRAFT_729884, partial [Exidia glandulosa HHB12029]
MPGTFASGSDSPSPRAATSTPSRIGRVEAWLRAETDPVPANEPAAAQDVPEGVPPPSLHEVVSLVGPAPESSSSRSHNRTIDSSSASRIHGLHGSPSPSQLSMSTIRLSEPALSSAADQTDSDSPIDIIIRELKNVKRQLRAQERENAVKSKTMEQLKREKGALHERCTALEKRDKAREKELKDALRRIESLERYVRCHHD